VRAGVDHWLSQCFGPFKRLLAKDWDKGWEMLMRYDKYSARTFLSIPIKIKNHDGTIFLEKDAYPNSVINWIERMDTGTGTFDMAFSEMVLDDLQFDYPTAAAVKAGATPPEGTGDWFCIAGGSEVLVENMLKKLKPNRVHYNKMVTAIAPTDDNTQPISVTYSSGRTDQGVKSMSTYDYVISTIPLPVLRYVDLEKCNLTYAQKESMRSLRYNSSCKVGLKWRSRWWQQLSTGSIIGGQSKTDLPIRVAVFPSYGVEDQDADAVMIASYTWAQDAVRIGGLMKGTDTQAEKFLIDSILRDLSALHNVSTEFLSKELVDWFAWDWSADQFALGAFAHFGPSEFSDVYTAWTQSAAGGRLLFAGEALSAQHAWVEGALDSAYWAVWRMLKGANRPDLVAKLEKEWGNKLLADEEKKELENLMWLQELLGAILSAFTDIEARALAFEKAPHSVPAVA
jgi:monoamine oxidase